MRATTRTPVAPLPGFSCVPGACCPTRATSRRGEAAVCGGITSRRVEVEYAVMRPRQRIRVPANPSADVKRGKYSVVSRLRERGSNQSESGIGEGVRVSLRTALSALPDDRNTVHAAHEVLACFAMHVGEPLAATRISRSTGLDASRVMPVLEALAKAVVINCDGDPCLGSCTFSPNAVLSLEVERYLRSGGSNAARMQASLGKFRSRAGRD